MPIERIVPSTDNIRGKDIESGYYSMRNALPGGRPIEIEKGPGGRQVTFWYNRALADRMYALKEATNFSFANSNLMGKTLGPQIDDTYVRQQYLFAQTSRCLDAISDFSDLFPWKELITPDATPLHNVIGSMTIFRPVGNIPVEISQGEVYFKNAFFLCSSYQGWDFGASRMLGMMLSRDYTIADIDQASVSGYELESRGFSGQFLSQQDRYDPCLVRVPKQYRDLARNIVVTMLPVYDALIAEATALSAALQESYGKAPE